MDINELRIKKEALIYEINGKERKYNKVLENIGIYYNYTFNIKTIIISGKKIIKK
jgi:hypothetical protein